MQTIPLGSTGRTTTRLGFGCSSIMGVLNRRQSLALLESSFEAGIRHFDTAPMYGYGEAESCLGEFLSRHRNEVTVTTKFGIPPPKSGGVMQIARGVLGPVAQRFPALKRLRRGPPVMARTDTKAASIANPIFTPEDARVSLERSLAALRTERIDLWLLHEVKTLDLAAESRNDPLLRMLEDVVREGKVGMFGVGSDREVVPELIAKRPEYCGAVQYEWSILNPLIHDDSRLRIHHRAMSQHFHDLAGKLKDDPERCLRWTREVGADIGNSNVLARLMLKASWILNPASVLLFSSKRPEHIRENVAILEDESLEAPARRLYGVVQREQLRAITN